MTEYKKTNPDNNINPHTQDSTTTPVKEIGTFTSLRIPNFRMLLTGSVLSNAINWIQNVILGWLVYDLTGSGTILGSISIITSMAALFMIPIAGLLVDRFNRRKLMLLSNSWLFTITFMLGILLLSGHSRIMFIFIFAFLFSMGHNVDMTLRQVLIFNLVPLTLAPNAVALSQTGWAVMRVIGPSIGGFLIIWFGAGGSFLIQAGIYILIALTIFMIKFPEQKFDTNRSSPIENIKDGLKFVIGSRLTRTFILMGIVLPLLAIPIFATLPPIYAVQVFNDESGRVLGFLMASVGVGGILGGLVTASLRRLEHWGRLQLASLFLLSIALVTFAFNSRLIVALTFLSLAGFFEIIFLTTNQTIIQLSIPEKLRGRVTAVVNLTFALSPLGNMMAGTGSDLFGPQNITVILASATAAITVLIFLFSPTVRNYRLSKGIVNDFHGL